MPMGKNICLAECQAACCKDLLIALSHIDVQRILKHKRIDLSKFIKFYTKVNPDFYKNTVSIAAIKINNADYLMALNMADHNELCPFLKNGKCNIYSYRPMVCRTYPFMIDGTGLLYHQSKSLCPRKWGDPAITKARKNYLQLLEEYRIYRRRVAWWNLYCSNLEIEDFIAYIFDDLPPINRFVTADEAFSFIIDTRMNNHIPPHSKDFFMEYFSRETLTRYHNIAYKKLRRRKITALKSHYNKTPIKTEP